MRELYFGGSFNPIHLGHIKTAQAVAKRAGFERVVIVPAAVSPHKIAAIDFAADLAPMADRLAMCRLAANSADAAGLFRVDDLELHRAPPSYTIDTVRELRARGVDPVFWLIGGDQVAQFPRWREAEALISEASIVVMARPGYTIDFDALPAVFAALRRGIVEIPPVDISATDIRRRVRLGLSIAQFVPAEVAEYIASRGLYAGKRTRSAE